MSKGKAIYNPSGKAGEYARWACNLYVGCSNNCAYCYCKRGVLGTAMGAPTPKLKSCFHDEQHAFDVFVKELDKNIDAIRQSSLFFTFTSDPLIPETRALNVKCIDYAVQRRVRCQVLTKNADFVQDKKLECIISDRSGLHYSEYLSFGFTLTGHDELEQRASSNSERIKAMNYLHSVGFKTFASFEPIIDLEASYRLVKETLPFCDLYKFGLLSGKLPEADGLYKVLGFGWRLENFYQDVCQVLKEAGRKAYWKESVNKALLHYDILSEHSCNVPSEYDIFTDK